MGTSVFQPSFAGGELSKRLRGRIDSELYGRGLDFCENFEVLPQGPLRMRAGSIYEGAEASAPRLVPFRAAGEADDFVLAFGNGKMKVYKRGQGRTYVRQNLFANTHFDTDLASWTVTGTASWAAPGVAKLTYGGPPGAIAQSYVFSAPRTYRITFKYRGAGGLTFAIGGSSVGLIAIGAWQTYSYDFVVSVGASHTLSFTAATSGYAEVDDVTVSSAENIANELTAPYYTTDLIQYAQDLVVSRMALAHPGAFPHVAHYTSPDVWELYEAAFINRPSAWTAAASPGAVEFGFQGRAYYGGTSNDPNGLWASKAGAPFDFTGGANPDDALDLRVSAKGTVRWIQGQKALLLGTDATEHAITGSGGVVAQGDYQVRDESAHGSAAVQAVHIGDQVVFVTPDRRRVRAVNYDFQENGWVSRALTFAAEHLTEGLVKEIHYVSAPESYLVVVLVNGDVVACTYDRAEQVLAWWRIDVGAPVVSAAVAMTTDGGELWLAVHRGTSYFIERIPVHENGRRYLDASIQKQVGVAGVISGLEHLNGLQVSVERDGTLLATGLNVVGGAVTVDAENEGAYVIVGLAYRATAVTLPRNAKGGKVRTAKIGLLLNDSALPLVNRKRASERSPSTALDLATPRVTGKAEVTAQGWDEEGKITIEQDLPFRTEILALYSTTQTNEA